MCLSIVCGLNNAVILSCANYEDTVEFEVTLKVVVQWLLKVAMMMRVMERQP